MICVKVYNKLVRDKVPEIIRESGSECEITKATDAQYFKLLRLKLRDEMHEFIETENIEELADIMEVIFSLAKALGYTEEDLIKAREDKRKEKGGFDEGIILKNIFVEDWDFTRHAE